MLTFPELKTNLDQGSFKSWSVFALLSQTGAVSKPHTHTMTHSPICVPLPKTLGLSLTLPYNNLSPRPFPLPSEPSLSFFSFLFFLWVLHSYGRHPEYALAAPNNIPPATLVSYEVGAMHTTYVLHTRPRLGSYMHLLEMRKTTHSPTIL